MAPNTMNTENSPLETQELVNLAREILVVNSSSEEGIEITQNIVVQMATPEGTEKHAESPTARFTAVNGRNQNETSPTTNGNGNVTSTGVNGNGVARRGSDERPNGQPRISPPGHEKLTITTTQDQDWSSSKNGERTHLPDRQMNTSQNSNHYSDDNSHKRKRSGSMDQGSSSANSYHSHALPNSTKATPTTATTESDGIRDDGSVRAKSQPHLDSRETYSADSQYRQFMSATDSARDTPSNDLWHSRHYPQHPQVASDEHIGEVLQRASQNLDAQQHEYDRRTLSGDDNRYADPQSAYSQERRELSAQSDLKKRKRNFSNRTKTGCMTCRRRKKKCDESRPECNNCLRGGFVCSGYQQRGSYPKVEMKQTPVPLQSKTEYESPSSYTQPSPYGNQPGIPTRREPLPGYRGQSLRVDPHSRAITDADDQASATTLPSASITSPENNRISASGYGIQQTPTPVSANSAHPDRYKSEYPRVGPLHDLSRQEPRTEPDTGTPHSAREPTSALPNLLNHQIHPDSPHSSAQVAAQLALSHPASRQRTQKEEMLAGRHYFPFDKELVLERERCNTACWRFNNSTNPNNGVSPEERARQFRDILQPRDHVISPTQATPVTPVGKVGDNVVVEAPFTCDYGYNISIGQDVAIGKNCTILDTCEVKIGDRCNIGPNVNLYTATLHIDPKRRLGSRGPNLGRKIIIQEDCWIGGGVTILPGRTIGKGSTVGAGSIVTRDVPPYTVVCGNPARVIRGLYPPHEG
ncbi:uncharacterized protein EAF02_006045 [Botrytis sinoallii]|uniref:uncharacterized protein n=1 Tax=Botrytis sinoallii TaxID=1463999 RepID=UPI0018FFFE01|nr:uncharacterized protein EAF02_006045 [Botrytis sinoallii]KAF7882682.1 hypothetical protein EAF02_006045 [Botrytis sinoallii]